MNRRMLIAACGVAALLSWRAARSQPAQQGGRPFRVGVLSAASPEAGTRVSQVFVEAMRVLGYVEGRNVIYERRFAHGAADRLPGLAMELVQVPVDVIVTGANITTAAAKQATSTIPIVMVYSIDPDVQGFIRSYSHPGGNITGMTYGIGTRAYRKRLELLKEIVPGLAKVAVLVQRAQGVDMADLDAAARQLRLQLEVNEVRTVDDIVEAFAAMSRNGAGAYLGVGGPIVVQHRQKVAALALAHRLPGVHAVREMVDAGALANYGPSQEEMIRRSARYVDKILKGAKPADLAVEAPERYELIVNLKTAQALGLTIPQSVLLRADEVIR